MKKNLLIVFASCAGSMMAQLPVGTAPQNKAVLLEEFTGLHCGYCPDGHVKANNIHDADPSRVVLVNIHSGSFANPSQAADKDFRTSEGTAIDGMPGMGITGYPAGTVNRKVLVGSVMATGRGNWTSMANTIKNQPAYCNIALQGTLNPQTRVLTVDVEVYYTANSPVTTNSLNVFLLENNIPAPQTNYGSPYWNIDNYNQDGTYNHHHVLRKAITPTFGMTIPVTTSGNLFTTTLTYTLPATYPNSGKTTIPNFENLELVGFVTQSDRDVINAANGKVGMTQDIKAVSVSLPTFICANTLSADVTIENTGMTAITNLTITPSVDAVNQTPVVWTGNLAPGTTTTVALTNISATTGGGHTFKYVITGDDYTLNNSGTGDFYLASSYQGTPVAEGFVLGAFPPVSWGISNTDNGPGWTRKFGTGFGAFNASSESAKYDFFTNAIVGDKDELFLPPMDLLGSNDPDMFFDISYAQRNANSNDMLEVFVSDDCGANWTNVYTASGLALATAPAPVGFAYVPSAAEWRTEVITLPGFNKSNVLVKFVATSDNGNNLYLDNVNLMQTAPNSVGISKVNTSPLNVSLYPNPTNGVTNVIIHSKKAGEATITVTNMLGQEVVYKNVTLNEGTNSVRFDMIDNASGIYNVSIKTQNGSVVKKLNVTK